MFRSIFIVFCLLYAALSPACAIGPTLPDPKPLPTVDPQARQILAAMVNTYRFDVEAYADEEAILATGDTTGVSSQYINSRFTVMLIRGEGLFLTGTEASGEKFTVHTFQQGSDQFHSRFLVFTTSSRFPGLYRKDTVTSYEEAMVQSFRQADFGTVGAAELFSERDIGSLLLHTGFQGLRLGQPLVIDGVLCDSVMIEIGNDGGNNTLALSIGQKDHLLRRLTTTHVQGAQTTIVTENHTHIRTHGFPSITSVFAPHYFQYAPPHGSHRVSFFPYPATSTHPASLPTVPPGKTHEIGK